MTRQEQRRTTEAAAGTALDYDEITDNDNDDRPSRTRCEQCGATELYYNDGCWIACAACEA